MKATSCPRFAALGLVAPRSPLRSQSQTALVAQASLKARKLRSMRQVPLVTGASRAAQQPRVPLPKNTLLCYCGREELTRYNSTLVKQVMPLKPADSFDFSRSDVFDVNEGMRALAPSDVEPSG